MRPLLTEVRDIAARNRRMHRTVPQQIIWPHDRSDKVEKHCSGAFKELGTSNSGVLGGGRTDRSFLRPRGAQNKTS